MKVHVVHRPVVVLFDPDCGLCVAGIGWLRERVRGDRVLALPLTAVDEDPRLSQLLAGRDLSAAIHAVLPDDRVRTGAAAVLTAGRAVPRWGVLARLYDNTAGRALLEPAYRLVAANRTRIARALGIGRRCAVPG
jgi:predicted DCC family thiol-disulfide oxidoreductase YuxK